MPFWNVWTESLAIIIGGGLAIAVSVRNVIENQRKDKRLNDQNEKLLATQDKLTVANDSLIKQTSYNFDFITGGKSFPIVDFMIEPGKCIVFARNDGDFPLWDLTVDVYDEKQMLAQPSTFSFDTFQSLVKGFSANFVSPKSGRLLGVLTNKIEGEQVWRSNTSTRNGYFKQRIGARNRGGEWVYAVVVLKEDKEVYRFINAKYLNPGETFDYSDNLKPPQP